MTGNGQITWEDPPEHNQSTWVLRLTPVMERPGQWARVKTWHGSAAHATASLLRRGRTTAPPGRWEFLSRSLGDGTSALYARYLGPEDPS